MTEESRTTPDARAQLLATEHWSLLASRSTTQSEVLTRITMFLTFVSAGLVSLALVGNVTDFADPFPTFAIALLSIVAVAGVITQIRVMNVGAEDLMYVLAMNRLRAAYVELEPSIRPYFMTSVHDDHKGADQTYYFLGARTSLSHMLGSSMVFIAVVNSAMVGLLTAAIASASGVGTTALVVIGAVVGVLFLVGSMVPGGRGYFRLWREYRPLSPTPEVDAPSASSPPVS